MSTALERLFGGYYNSGPFDAGDNPGGLGLGGHVVNLPALLQDIGTVTSALNAAVLDAEAVSAAAVTVADLKAQVEAAAGPVIAGLASFGMPGRVEVLDLNTLAKSGWFHVSDATGRPAGEGPGFVFALSDGAADNGAQIYIAELNGKTYTRRRVAGTWAVWDELTTAATVIDTAYGPENTLASAATVDLGAAGSRLVQITGATSITSFGSSAAATNPTYMVRFAGSLTLTHHATDLILPRGRNVVTEPGDHAVLQYLGAGKWRCIEYVPVSGQALVTAGYGAATVMASAATVDLGLAAHQLVEITGVAAITSFGASAVISRPLYRIVFSGALTLTHHAVSLKLPGGANIVTTEGDSAVALYMGGGNWRVLDYQRADGKVFGAALASAAVTKAGVSTALAVTPAALAETIQSGAMAYVADSSAAANLVTVALTPPVAALATGLGVRVKVNTTNTDAATLNLNGLGEVSIKRFGRNLVAGELRDGQVYDLVYDGSFWQLLSPADTVTRHSAYFTVSGGFITSGGSPFFSLSRTGTGAYTITLTTAAASISDWGVSILAGNSGGGQNLGVNEKTKSASALTLQVRNGGNNLDEPSSFDITVWAKL